MFRGGKKEHWRGIVSCFKESGLSQRAFSGREGLAKNRLSYWVRKFSGGGEAKKGSGDFVELSREVVSRGEGLSRVRVEEVRMVAELVFPDGTVLRLRG